jgi:tetratricopeptide (TPR) repeat protein
MQRESSLRTALRFHALRAIEILIFGLVATSAASTAELSDQCYADTPCWAQEATRDISQVKQERLQWYVSSLADLQMFDLAREAVKRIDRSNLSGQLNWKNANEDVAVFEVAAQALNAPDKIASLAPLESLTKPESEGPGFDMPSQCRLVVDAIIHRALSIPINALVAKALGSLVKADNATLNYLLTVRWPQEIEHLPRNKQGEQWYELGRIWLDLGNPDRAEQATTQAEQTGWVDFQGVERVYDSTWRNWLRLGNYARAIKAADHASNRSSAAFFKLEIARSFIDAKRFDEALTITTSALSDARLQRNSVRDMGYLHEIVDLRIAADDASGAGAVAEEMAALAHQRSLVPAGQLAMAATAFNDLGDHGRASELLKEAIARLPSAQQVLGFGMTLGPITGSSLGLADSLRSQIAVELYRSGDTKGFDDQLRQLGNEYRARTWGDLCAASGLGHWTRPSESDCLDGAGTVLLVHWAADAIARTDTDAAQRFLSRAIAANGQLLDVARLAVAINKNDLADTALVAAARAADHLPDPGDREAELANVAATRKQLLP